MTETAQTKVTKVVDVSNIYNTNIMKLEKENELKKAAEEGKKIQLLPITDKKTYETVHDMQMKLLKLRTGVANDRKDFTKHLDEKKAAAIEIEKELIGIISPTEEALKLKKEEYEKEQERIKEEKKAEEARILQSRIDRMNAIQAAYDIAWIAAMSDEGFDMLYDMHKKRFDQNEKIRIEQEERKEKIQKRKDRLAEIGMYIDGESYTHDLIATRLPLEEITDTPDDKFDETYTNLSLAISQERDAIRKQREENDRVATENAKKAQELKEKEDALKAQEQVPPPAPPEVLRTYSGPAHRPNTPETPIQQESPLGYDHDKYAQWLKDNGYEAESGDFYIEPWDTEVILWKKVAIFTL